MEAAGVNRPDLQQRAGKYPPPPDASPILGLEVAGHRGRSRRRLRMARRRSRLRADSRRRVRRVLPGARRAVPAGAPRVSRWRRPPAFPRPSSRSGPTSSRSAHLTAGERFLVHGGTSGIGTTAIQLAHAFGATVFTTAGSEVKCRACEALGADARHQLQGARFRRRIRGSRPDSRYRRGGVHSAQSRCASGRAGRLVQIAVQKGVEATVNLAKVMHKRLTITGSTMRPRPVAKKGAIAARTAREGLAAAGIGPR